MTDDVEIHKLTATDDTIAVPMSRRTSLLVHDELSSGTTGPVAPVTTTINNCNVPPELLYQSQQDPTMVSIESPPPVQQQPYWRSSDGKELLGCVLFAGVCVLSTISDAVVTERPIPFQLLNTGEYVRNLSYNEIFDGETVPDALLIVVAVVIPLLVQLLSSKVLGERGDVHATVCIYLVALGLTQMTTGLLKMYCGYLRPIFYSICEPDQDYESCTGDTGSSESYRRSFPSGHASTSFCGLTLLTLFIHTRFGVPSLQRKLLSATATTPSSRPSNLDPFKHRSISIVSLIPMGIALFIAASRVVDNKHFPADVVAGSVLGASIANFVHGLWL
jgi:diacylglycerol diphosphate phosphatase / phosphatidate phosphatase